LEVRLALGWRSEKNRGKREDKKTEVKGLRDLGIEGLRD
jgi:hypothetical protein